eukprot:TRINITY_DN29289_c0_g1_i1.p1 TRINITY_DN29289_c0_g1~~TRINITY_DN29289_c0_g1_i1.p1  ORF type:complete len:541 (+),score=51.47 TRINITY_DN29289_c0_g1_i1:60-1682(+)
MLRNVLLTHNSSTCRGTGISGRILVCMTFRCTGSRSLGYRSALLAARREQSSTSFRFSQKASRSNGQRVLLPSVDQTDPRLWRFQLSDTASPEARSTVGAALRLAGLRGLDAASTSWKRALEKIFLPVDYPESVASNYLNFSKAMALQIMFSNVSKVLATQAMLLAVGVGSKTALPMAAVTAWVLKDGFGHILAIAFGTFVNTRFDSDPKRYRFQAACVGKLADFVSICTLYRPDLFLLFSTLGGACGRLSTNTASSCRAKIYETLSRNNNLGDVLRCATAQSTAAQLIGTGLGAMMGPMVGSDLEKLLVTNFVFSVLGIYYSYQSSSMVQMATLNVQRAEYVFANAVSTLLIQERSEDVGSVARAPLVSPSLAEVQLKEEFFLPYKSIISEVPLAVNPTMSVSRHVYFAPDVKKGADGSGFGNAGYILGFDAGGDQIVKPNLAVWYLRGANPSEGSKPTDVLKGFFHATLLRSLIRERHAALSPNGLSAADYAELHEQSHELTQQWWLRVKQSLEVQGWRTDITFLDTREDRLCIIPTT